MPLSETGSVKGLVVAAGMGTRLRSIAPSKPLALVCGVPLIESVIETAALAGVDRFVVVTGYESASLEVFLGAFARRSGFLIETVHNPDWTRPNGLSVAAAEAMLDEYFVLMMADHLFEPVILSDLLAAPRVAGGVTLAVDRRLDNPMVDLDDVTRVETDSGGRIVRIGKGLEAYDAFDTGVFLASTGLIDAIRSDVAEGGTGSISAGMARLADAGLACSFDIGDRFWLDVDDPASWEQAERLRA